MIKLEKLSSTHEAVVWLAKAEREFKERFDSNQATPSDYARYRDSRVKTAILCETLNKCAYCESKYAAVAFGDVEHILPKSRDPRERTLNYRNLTLVCGYCNVTKSNHEFPPPEHLLDPYADDPGKYFFCSGPYLMATFGATEFCRADKTIETIGLNRTNLVEQRRAKLLECYQLVLSYKNAMNEGIGAYAFRKIQSFRKPDAEYSLFTNAFFKNCGI